MHLNYYVLKRLVRQLSDILRDAQILEIFSQEKDELILAFLLENKEEFYIRATLQSDFTALSFPENFARSKKNNVNIFPELIGNHVVHIHQYENERAFHIAFQNGSILLFKMHGNRSNIIFKNGGTPLQLFKKKLAKDYELQFENLERPIERKEHLFLSNPDFRIFYPTLGKLVHNYLDSIEFKELNPTSQWQFLERLIEELENNPFFISKLEGKPSLSLIKFGEIHQEIQDPIEALNYFFRSFHYDFRFEKEKNEANQLIAKQIQQATNYINKTEQQLTKIESATPPNEIADIIMANLHNLKPGMTKAKLFNFYNNQEIEIKLKKDLSPQKNAEQFYRKSKNRRIEIDKLTENILHKEEQKALMLSLQEKLTPINDLKSLRKFMKEHFAHQQSGEKEVNKPYKAFEVHGYQIWVGKNAKSNDELTLKHSFKEDTWLHAKDVPGSHVLIKHKSGQTIPNTVLERAAELAAYYSKRKTDTLVPVIHTPVKYVRKKKGSAPGQVFVSRENVVMVPAKGPSSEA